MQRQDVGEGSVSDLAQSTNVPPLNLGALAGGTQTEQEDERETSFDKRDGQLVAVHLLPSLRDPTVVIPLLGTPFLPRVGLGNVNANVQEAAETLEQLYTQYHPANGLLTSPTNVSSLRLTVPSKR